MLSPLYGQLSPLRIPTRSAVREVQDTDALAYIAAVETEDGQTLEDGVKFAFEDFIVGCKSDGIWSAIKASCILAGARTLSGALVPLVGTAPTNNNFVSADYNRETGLLGQSAASKRIVTNRNTTADPQDNFHISVFVSTWSSIYPIGTGVSVTGSTSIIDRRVRNRNSTLDGPTANFTNFGGTSRSSASQYTTRFANTTNTYTRTSQATYSAVYNIFATGLTNGTAQNYNSNRISFYSIGESLNLALLDSRVSTLMTALAAAI